MYTEYLLSSHKWGCQLSSQLSSKQNNSQGQQVDIFYVGK